MSDFHPVAFVVGLVVLAVAFLFAYHHSDQSTTCKNRRMRFDAIQLCLRMETCIVEVEQVLFVREFQAECLRAE